MEIERKKRPLPITMPEYMHHLLGYAAELDGATMASFARAAIMAAVEIRIEEHRESGGELAPDVLPYWRAADPTDWELARRGKRATKA